MKDDQTKTETDNVGSLLPAAGETKLGWGARILKLLTGWWRKPRSRVGFLLVATAILMQGCATAAWHNYQVAEAEASERAQLEAGLIPLVKTNGDIVRDNWAGYVGGALLDGAALYFAYKYIQRDTDQVVNNNTTNNDNRTLPPEPIYEEPQGVESPE